MPIRSLDLSSELDKIDHDSLWPTIDLENWVELSGLVLSSENSIFTVVQMTRSCTLHLILIMTITITGMEAVKNWMSNKFLKLNEDKTKYFWLVPNLKEIYSLLPALVKFDNSAFSNVFSFCLQEYTCPRCDSGFIEELLEERRWVY